MEVRETLRRLSVPASAYSIGHDSNEAYCLIEEADGWHLFYSERGHRTAEQVFSTEADAGAELKRRILVDATIVSSMQQCAD